MSLFVIHKYRVKRCDVWQRNTVGSVKFSYLTVKRCFNNLSNDLSQGVHQVLAAYKLHKSLHGLGR